MPLRFRKIFKIAPGLKINLSKSGITTSLGKAGASLNIGKKGIRTTFGIPGSGLSFSKLHTQRPNVPAASNGSLSPITQPIAKTKRKMPLGFLVASSVFAMLCQIFFCFSSLSGAIESSTPTPTIDVASVQSTALAKAWLIYTQTAAAMPTITPVPTQTIAPTETPAPTQTPLPTNTLAPLPTATIFIEIFPTQPQSSGGSGNFDSNSDGKITCSDFNYQHEAQQAYNAGYTNLDGNDNDGKACESLP